jgi:hypothetical protein
MVNADQYKLEIRFGDDLLEAGFTCIPNLFIVHYDDLGISDAAAMLVVHLLKFKWTEKPCWPTQGGLPMSSDKTTRRCYVRKLRNLGLLFTRRRYYAKETAPTPEMIGKMEALEYHFDALFHNVVRMAAHRAEKKPLAAFRVEIPEGVVSRVVKGYFQDVPKVIKQACERHVIKSGFGVALLCDFLLVEKLVVGKRIPNEEDSLVKKKDDDDVAPKAFELLANLRVLWYLADGEWGSVKRGKDWGNDEYVAKMQEAAGERLLANAGILNGGTPEEGAAQLLIFSFGKFDSQQSLALARASLQAGLSLEEICWVIHDTLGNESQQLGDPKALLYKRLETGARTRTV